VLKHLLSLSTALVLSNCSAHANRVENSTSQNYKKHKTPSAHENLLLLVALDNQVRGDHLNSATVFKKLFEEYEKDEYSIELFKSLNALYKFDEVIEQFEKLDNVTDEHKRQVAFAYIGLKNAEKGFEIISTIVEKTALDYSILANYYAEQENYESALENFKKVYSLMPTDKVAIVIAKILRTHLEKPNEAIAFLKEAKQSVKSIELSVTLTLFLQEAGLFVETAKMYGELYKETGEVEFGQFAVKFFNSFGETEELISFLKDSNFNNDLLLRIYMNRKMNKEGFALSQELFNQTQKPIYLAQNAIFQYELLESKWKVEPIIEKLEEVVDKLNDATFYNYLGYLMIDKNKRISDGIKYVKKALKLEPENLYIVDSLAWGLYKIGDCKNAKIEMKKVFDVLGEDEEEIRSHWDKIRKCKN
jgi:tetratricopeptide (TPR) repeat protein